MTIYRTLLAWLLGVAPALLIAASGTVVAAERKPLWLAVGRNDLVEPLKALVEKRQGEGFSAMVTTKTIDEALAESPRPDFLLLVGDDEPGKERSPWHLPAKRKTLYRWREGHMSQTPKTSANPASHSRKVRPNVIPTAPNKTMAANSRPCSIRNTRTKSGPAA